ncbi:uncharacterized protein LOC118348668 [Juglans regia]|uniref:Uncharacterized protein LOC118348668 n=1 Tax=Juglans regia TaxID=51240 RepID=A0A6P9ERZ5_JUGRE|nr:uncharacterized protein LOC118348668 [Juglans regia]
MEHLKSVRLERLKEVDVFDCPNLVNFGKKVGHNGQSMLCTHENEISARANPTIDATGCGLLERFHNVSTESSFGIPELKRLTRIDLSECNKVEVDVGNRAPDPLWVQKRFHWKDSSRIIYPGSRIPEWFKYCKETTSYSNSIEIEIDHNASMCFGHQIVALVLCFVVGPLLLGFKTITISING